MAKKGVDFVWNPGIPSASDNSIRSSYENEVEERSVETELAEDSTRVVRGNERGINLLVGESLPKRYPEDLDSALRMALQLEVWTKDRARLRGEKTQ